MEAYARMNDRLNQINGLIKQLNESTTLDAKGTADLQARIQGEQAMIQNEQTKLQVMVMLQKAEQEIHDKKVMESATKFLKGTKKASY